MIKYFFALFLALSTSMIFSQTPNFFPYEHWKVSGYGIAINVDIHDLNKDGKQDIVVGNWNDTYVYFGGAGTLDSTADIIYSGRLLAMCDYNGDSFKDLITMHFINFDSSRWDYDGEILFYWGSDTNELFIDTLVDYSIPLPTIYPSKEYFAYPLNRQSVESGDFNNDGKDDIVISSYAYPLPGGYGKIYIYMGNETPPDTVSFAVSGKFINGQPVIRDYGYHFQVGNINGDSYDDLLLSSTVRKIPPVSNPTDSLDVLDIYLGSENFQFVEGGESLRYESRVENSFYSYGWFKKEFSMWDLNGDGYSDLILSHWYKDSTNHVHFGSESVIDTIPSFFITDPDTTREDLIVGPMGHNIGDFNDDGYSDFILYHSYPSSFSLHLGGPYFSNENPYGLRGLLEACSIYPIKAMACGDQNGDGVEDFVTIAPCGRLGEGYVLIFRGNPNIVTANSQDISSEENTFRLLQNYPNPFNPTTRIRYDLPEISRVTCSVYDLLGRKVKDLEDNQLKQPGSYELTFDASGLSSGVYFYRISANDYVAAKKMIVIK